MYNKYHNMQQIKILMAFFGKLSKQKQKQLDLYDNIILWNSLVHYESNLILIQWLDEEDWIKSMYIRYIIYTFSTAIGPDVVIHNTLLNKRRMKKLL